MISIVGQTCLRDILIQPLMTDGSLTVLILVGGIVVGFVIGMGLGAFYFGFKFWYRTHHDRIQGENVNLESMQWPQLISENMMSTKPCVKCGKALPLDAHYCSECREEQNYS